MDILEYIYTSHIVFSFLSFSYGFVGGVLCMLGKFILGLSFKCSFLFICVITVGFTNGEAF